MASHTQPTALVTGGNRGIGRATAVELARRGHAVIVTSRSAESASAAFAGLAPGLRPVEVLRADLTAQSDLLAVADRLGEAYGVLDVLVNNAGVWLESPDASTGTPHRASGLEPEVLRATFETNFFAPVRLTQLLLPLIRKAEFGRVLNIASLHASLTEHSSPGSPVYDRKVFGYGASKTALNAFTVQLAHELAGSTVTVNSLDPGWVRTGMGGPAASLSAEECGAAVAELITRLTPGVNGRFLGLDAGADRPW